MLESFPFIRLNFMNFLASFPWFFHWKAFGASTKVFSKTFFFDFLLVGLRGSWKKFTGGLNNHQNLLIYRFILIAINKSNFWLIRCFNQISRCNLECSLMLQSNTSTKKWRVSIYSSLISSQWSERYGKVLRINCS